MRVNTRYINSSTGTVHPQNVRPQNEDVPLAEFQIFKFQTVNGETKTSHAGKNNGNADALLLEELQPTAPDF